MKFRPATAKQVADVDMAVTQLILARDALKRAGATKALARVRLALSSARGAERHVWNRYQRTKDRGVRPGLHVGAVLDMCDAIKGRSFR
jgi:hypothetical protein